MAVPARRSAQIRSRHGRDRPVRFAGSHVETRYCSLPLPSLKCQLARSKPSHANAPSTVAYDPRALDVWSCAIVCFALFFRGAPWNAAEPTDPMFAPYLRAWKTFEQQHPDGNLADMDIASFGRAFTHLPSFGLQRLLLSMLNPDPQKRISIDTALNDRFVRSIDCCCPDSATRERESRKYKSATIPCCHRHGPPPPTKRSFLYGYYIPY